MGGSQFQAGAGIHSWESGQDHLALYLHNGPEYLEGCGDDLGCQALVRAGAIQDDLGDLIRRIGTMRLPPAAEVF